MKRGRVSPRAVRQLLQEREREGERGEEAVYVPELINPHNPSDCTPPVSTLSRKRRACQPFCPRLSLSKFHYPLSPPPPFPPANYPTRSSPFSALASLSVPRSRFYSFTRSNVFHVQSSPFGIIHGGGGFASLPSLHRHPLPAKTFS